MVQVWATGMCKCPHIMSLVRQLFFFLAQQNVNLHLAHVPGWCRPCTSAARALLSVPSLRCTSCLAPTPPSPVVPILGRVIPDPGPLGAHPPGGPFLPPATSTPTPSASGRVFHGGHGFLLGHDPGPWAVEGRLLPALRPAPRQVRVPPPTMHAEVFGVTRGGRACGGAVAPSGWRYCSLLVISALGTSSFLFSSAPPVLARFAYWGPPRNGNYQNALFTQDPDCSARFRPPLHWPGLVPVEFPRCSAHHK